VSSPWRPKGLRYIREWDPSAMIRAILFDQGDTLWLCFVLCGMNPAAFTEAEGFNPQGCSNFPGGLKASPTFRYPVNSHKASATFGSGIPLP